MTNVDKVKAQVYGMRNQFTSKDMQKRVPELTVEQTGKALKAISTVKSLGNGRFSIRGRLVK